MIKRLRREERGMALVMTLGLMVALAIAVTAVIEYTSSNSRASGVNESRQSADHVAEAGLQAAYSILNYWDTASATGNNANDPTLLGCAGNGSASDCSTVTTKCISVLSTCPSPTSIGVAGTASIWGSYSGTPTNLWTITSVGYARNVNSATPFTF